MLSQATIELEQYVGQKRLEVCMGRLMGGPCRGMAAS